ncbi:MAG: NAD(P)H-binding protein [Patescibacteria group bacterium]
MAEIKKVLITGATGYIGRQLLSRLSQTGIKVSGLTRDKRSAGQMSVDFPAVDFRIGDALDYDSMFKATRGVDIIYYLLHALESAPRHGADEAAEKDRLMAQNTVRAAKTNGAQRIIYLGGMYNPAEKLSLHLQSRREVEEIITRSKIPFTVFRASVIIGPGAAAFELLRAAIEKMPIIPLPSWRKTLIQPIASGDALTYLAKAQQKPETLNRCFDIGGPEIVSYAKLIKDYSRTKGLKRIFCPVPGQWRTLTAAVLQRIAPVNPNITFWLVESLLNNMTANPADTKELKTIYGFSPKPIFNQMLPNSQQPHNE